MTYQELLDTQNELDPMLERLNVRISPSDRIHRAYTALQRLEDVRKDPQLLKQHLERYNQDGHILQAVLDLTEIKEIMPALDGEKPHILKDKLEKILGGTLLRKDETERNQVARNTMFELLVLADLKSAGFASELGDPNPDVITTAGSGRRYSIECKRLYHPTSASLKRNVKDAFDQLNRREGRSDVNEFGVIALSVQRVIGGPDVYISTTSKESGLQFIAKEQGVFLEQYKNQWMNKNRAKSHRNVAVIIHHSGGLVVEPGQDFNRVTMATWVNVWADRPEFDLFVSDFQPMKDKLNTSDIFN